MRRLYAAILLISATAIAYEILLMRVLSIVQWHHFAYMIISLALLGYGASGTVIALTKQWLAQRFELALSILALSFSLAIVACYILAQNVPFNALEIVWDPGQILYLSAIYLIFFVPFFLAASCIGLAFTCHSSAISRIYFFDLFGAGLGAVLIIGALFWWLPQNALTLLAMLALLASALMSVSSTMRYSLFTAQAVWFIVLIIGLGPDTLGMRMSPFKGLSQAMQTTGSHVPIVKSSPLGLLTVVESPSVPFREAPGLSFNTRFIPPEQIAVFTDGDAISVITRSGPELDNLGYLGDVTAALPFQLLAHPRTLVLGAGGGADVLLALHNGASAVDAVELNPQLIELVAVTYDDFAGNLYRNDRVTVHVEEARGFVAKSDQTYDIIHIGLLDSFAASGAGVQALHENYLYTVEAMSEYLAHLADGGILAVTRWLKLPPRDSLKLVATGIAAMRETGISNPERRLVLIRSWNTMTMLVGGRDFDQADIATIREFARSRSFDAVFYPGIRAEEANRFNVLPEAFLYDGVKALLGDGADEYLRRYKFNLAPATDDRPYFFHFFKWRALNDYVTLLRYGGGGLVEWGYLVLIATLGQAAIAGLILIILPLLRAKPSWPSGTGVRMGSYFFLLGLAFLFVEIAFIQKFILFLSHPLYSVAVMLSGFLVFAGLGSALVDRWSAAIGRSALKVTVSGIAALAFLYVLFLPPVFENLMGLTGWLKAALSILLIAPLGFLMGMPFPMGLKRLAGAAGDFIPWAWGINGFASVMGASLATLLAIQWGFTAVVVVALCCYVAAALVFNGAREQ